LDGFYISIERQYRDLYNNVAQKTEEEIDFSMDASIYNRGNRTWWNGIFSKTLWPFYGITFGATLLVMFII
jgi:hypothetical protein